MTEGHPKGWKGVRMPTPEVVQYIFLVGPFHRKLATGSDVIIPRIFLISSTKVGWCVLYDVRVYPFPWLSVPFIFIITYKVCCFRICYVVLQGWYSKTQMNEMCDIFKCFVLFLLVTCFGWNFNAIVVVEEDEEGGRAAEEEGGRRRRREGGRRRRRRKGGRYEEEGGRAEKEGGRRRSLWV